MDDSTQNNKLTYQQQNRKLDDKEDNLLLPRNFSINNIKAKENTPTETV